MRKCKVIMQGIIAVIIAVSCIGEVYAAGSTAAVQKPAGTFKAPAINQALVTSRYKPAMDKLVKAKAITQKQEDAIINAMKASKNSKKTVKEILDSLVKAKTITQKQEDSIMASIRPNRGYGGPGRQHVNPMDGLVKAKTITQAQANAIMKAIQAARGSNKTTKAILDNLVKAKTITQKQEDAVLKILPSQMGVGRFGPASGGK